MIAQASWTIGTNNWRIRFFHQGVSYLLQYRYSSPFHIGIRWSYFPTFYNFITPSPRTFEGERLVAHHPWFHHRLFLDQCDQFPLFLSSSDWFYDDDRKSVDWRGVRLTCTLGTLLVRWNIFFSRCAHFLYDSCCIRWRLRWGWMTSSRWNHNLLFVCT